MADYAPEWDHQYVLTWSGRWHIMDVHFPRNGFSDHRRTLCGAYGYTRDHVPKIARLQSVAKGIDPAPKCKKCEKMVMK